MSEGMKKSIDIDNIQENDISRSQLNNNIDDTKQKNEISINFVQVNQNGDEVVAQKQAPIQLSQKLKQSGFDQKQMAKQLQNDNTKNQQTQTSEKFDSMIQNQNQRPREAIEEQVHINQFYYPNNQNNLIYQPVHYAPYSRSVLHLPAQRICCTPCLKIIMFLLFLIIGAGLTLFLIQKTKHKISISNKQLPKTPFVVPPVSSRQIIQKPKLSYESPENIISNKNQRSKTVSFTQKVNISRQQKAKRKNNTIINKQSSKIDVKKTQKFILKKGNRLFCSSNQLLINGNCTSCEFGEQWFGLDCIKQPVVYKQMHLLRKQYN